MDDLTIIVILIVIICLIESQDLFLIIPIIMGIIYHKYRLCNVRKKCSSCLKKNSSNPHINDKISILDVEGMTQSNSKYKERLFNEDEGCIGDNIIARKMKHMSTMSKRAQDARARSNKTKSDLFEEELEEHANRRWWDNQDYE